MNSVNGVTVDVAGEQFVLLPQKAVFWPRERLLAIADIHFGKAATFRSFGIPVPRGTTRSTRWSMRPAPATCCSWAIFCTRARRTRPARRPRCWRGAGGAATSS